MWWTNPKRIGVVAVLFIAASALFWFCLNLAAPWLAVLERNPVSVAFVGYTNSAVRKGFWAVPNAVPNAVFKVTNHSASRLIFHVKVEALPNHEYWVFAADNLGGHSVNTIEVPTPRDAGDAPYRVIFYVRKPLTHWQRKIALALARDGLYPAIFSRAKVYAPITNVLTVPSGKSRGERPDLVVPF
jgi:hypothetical protein